MPIGGMSSVSFRRRRLKNSPKRRLFWNAQPTKLLRRAIHLRSGCASFTPACSRFAISATSLRKRRRRSSASTCRRTRVRKTSTVTDTALARAAGFEASIVEVVDRSSATFEPDVLDASQLNAIVVLVRLKNENLYFDPASRFCPYGLLPWFESATKGVLWDKSGGAVLDVHAPANESSVIERTAELKLQPDGSLDGELDVVFTGQEALDRRLSASDEDETGRRKLLEDEIKALTPPGAKIDVDSVAGWQDLEQPLRVRCRFHASRFAVLTHQRMLFPMAVFQANRRSMLTHSKRMQPVYFRHGYSEVDKITISLPAGYRVEALSPDVNLKTTFATYQAKRTGEAGVVRLERHAVISQYSFPPESYGSLRQYLDQVRQSDAENVVLHGMRSEERRVGKECRSRWSPY